MTAPGSPRITAIAPFFIVHDVLQSLAFYRDRLGFELQFLALPEDPFFAIFQRDGVEIFVKAVGDGVEALPNHQRHLNASWDAFVLTPDPDALAVELLGRGLAVVAADREDGLRGFEIVDPDGYVLFFGRPREPLTRHR